MPPTVCVKMAGLVTAQVMVLFASKLNSYSPEI